MKAEIVYAAPPSWAKADVLQRLRARVGAVAAVDVTSPGLNFFFPDHRVAFRGQEMPVQCVIEVRAEDRVVVSDLLATGMEEGERRRLFCEVVAALSPGSAEVRWL